MNNSAKYNASLSTIDNKIYHPVDESLPSKVRRPGPRPSACRWCNKTNCNHCQCGGYGKCDHKQGEQCTRLRYKRRLVCNPCEKHKLKNPSENSPQTSPETTIVHTEGIDLYSYQEKKETKSKTKPLKNKNQSFNALLQTANMEFKKEAFKRSLSSLDTSGASPSMFTSNSMVFYSPLSSNPNILGSYNHTKTFKKTPEPIEGEDDIGLDLDSQEPSTQLTLSSNKQNILSLLSSVSKSTKPAHSTDTVTSHSLSSSSSSVTKSPVAIHTEPSESMCPPQWQYRVMNPFSNAHYSPIPLPNDDIDLIPLYVCSNVYIEGSPYSIFTKEFIDCNNKYILRLNEKSNSRKSSTDTKSIITVKVTADDEIIDTKKTINTKESIENKETTETTKSENRKELVENKESINISV